MALLSLAPVSAGAQLKINFSGDSQLRKLQMAEMAVTNLYVDSVDEEKLVEDAIVGMLSKLDPHSSYSTAKETKALNESLQGSFDGIGVQFNMVEDTLLVIQPVLKGPSEKVGIMAGQRHGNSGRENVERGDYEASAWKEGHYREARHPAPWC